jgi:hypothetical protein
MKQIQTNTLEDLDTAKIHINTLQDKLLACEQTLDDLLRVCELAQATGQYQLINPFMKQANNTLVDRMEIESVETKIDNINILSVEDE